jgi:leucyl aminopeptidase
MIRAYPDQVKPAEMTEIPPPTTSLKLTQTTGEWTRRQLCGNDHVAIVTPSRVPASLWPRLPAELQGIKATIRRLGKAGASQLLAASLPPATRITLARLPAAPAGRALPEPFAVLRFAGQLAAELLRERPRRVGLLVEGFAPMDRQRLLEALLLALEAHDWPMPQFRKKLREPALRSVQVLGLDTTIDFSRTRVEAASTNLVRWLTALPPNKLSAAAYRELVAGMAATHGWELEFLDEQALGRLGAGAFLAVAQANATRDAGIARLRYRPAGAAARPDLALVGKGIIFDTGGTNLKPFSSMLDMHEDMAGSAVALGLLSALTRLKSPLAVDCWLALTENRTGPLAYKPRDVVTACNGVTIEVIHTDAEGRMALADTLALAGREQPRLIVDFATLTGACMQAVTERYSGVFTNREQLHAVLVAAGRSSGERLWPFPLDEDFDEDIESPVADVRQCAAEARGDHILAARFLKRFVPEGTPWMHMDLSSASRRQGLGQVPGGPTGFGVRCTLALLLDHADALHEALSA